MIAYKNIKLLTDRGQIIDDAPYIHFSVQGDFIVFKPPIDSCLCGVVNKVGRDHVGLVVLNHFNVSVPIYRQEVSVTKGDKCKFTVAQIHMHRNLLSMRGKNIQLVNS